ncbi:hypothetical protein [Macrococcus brunensis]|uniref:hypothetical protein n=1 Tax=Macrococcus brunensis TaxID=198483 RepID=UPI001EF0C27A|nr:hypothetical protein [Macrococcus brunensis]ULG73490.1 hypothetical protein MGG13_07170 [Macrococcus brunensis]
MTIDNDVLYKYLDSISKEGRFDSVNNDYDEAELDYLFDEGLVEGNKADFQLNGAYSIEEMKDLKLTQQGQAMLEKLKNRW